MTNESTAPYRSKKFARGFSLMALAFLVYILQWRGLDTMRSSSSFEQFLSDRDLLFGKEEQDEKDYVDLFNTTTTVISSDSGSAEEKGRMVLFNTTNTTTADNSSESGSAEKGRMILFNTAKTTTAVNSSDSGSAEKGHMALFNTTNTTTTVDSSYDNSALLGSGDQDEKDYMDLSSTTNITTPVDSSDEGSAVSCRVKWDEERWNLIETEWYPQELPFLLEVMESSDQTTHTILFAKIKNPLNSGEKPDDYFLKNWSCWYEAVEDSKPMKDNNTTMEQPAVRVAQNPNKAKNAIVLICDSQPADTNDHTISTYRLTGVRHSNSNYTYDLARPMECDQRQNERDRPRLFEQRHNNTNHNTSSKPSKIGACLLAQGNSTFNQIPQWVEYHRLIGVQHFWIYINEPMQKTQIDSLYQQPYITYMPWHLKHPVRGYVLGIDFFAQMPEQFSCLHNTKRYQFDWFTTTDVDEYIQVVSNNEASSPRSYQNFLDDNYDPANYGCLEMRSIPHGRNKFQNESTHDLTLDYTWRHNTTALRPKGREKQIYNPQKINTLGVHYCWGGPGKRVTLNFTNEIRLNHYKRANEGIFRVDARKKEQESNIVQDTAFRDQYRSQVLQALGWEDNDELKDHVQDDKPKEVLEAQDLTKVVKAIENNSIKSTSLLETLKQDIKEAFEVPTTSTSDGTVASNPTEPVREAEDSAATANNTTIPRIMHFCYVSKYLQEPQPAIPDKVLNNIEGWQKLHPDWQVMVWNNKMVKSHFPHIAQLANNITIMAWVADLIRYHAVEKFGGIYMDTDIVAMQSLEPLRTLGAFTVCEKPSRSAPPYQHPTINVTDVEIQNKTKDCKSTINEIIGATKQHPALTRISQQVINGTIAAIQRRQVNGRFILEVTGPIAWSRVSLLENNGVHVLQSYTFLPCSGRNPAKNCIVEKFQNKTNIFGMHEWSKSW